MKCERRKPVEDFFAIFGIEARRSSRYIGRANVHLTIPCNGDGLHLNSARRHLEAQLERTMFSCGVKEHEFDGC